MNNRNASRGGCFAPTMHHASRGGCFAPAMNNASRGGCFAPAMHNASRGRCFAPTMHHAMTSVDLHIDRLVLYGFDDLDRVQLGAAVEAELARLFAEQGVPEAVRQDAAVARLDGGSFAAAPGAGADAIGAQIARAVYGGLQP